MKHPGVTAQTGEEARSLDGPKLDPKADYYAALGLDRAASAAEVRRAYKRLALLYHPDKYKSKGEDEQAAVAARFGEVTAAFDILVDEPQRALYDKVSCMPCVTVHDIPISRNCAALAALPLHVLDWI